MSQPQERGYVGALVDKLIGRISKLPGESCNYTTQPVSIPLLLAADLYLPILPIDEKPKGTILCNTPYGRAAFPWALSLARPFAARGYQVLLVSARGTFASQGSGPFSPCRHDVSDSRAVAAWMRAQVWYSGKFATMGSSYLALTQWALLAADDGPGGPVCCAMGVGVHDMASFFWATGALRMDMISWADQIANQERLGTLQAMYRTGWNHSRSALRGVLQGVPLIESLGRHAEASEDLAWLVKIAQRPDLDDEWYKGMRFGDRAIENAHVPVLLLYGWYDVFLEQGVEQYHRLTERGVEVRLIIGAYSHMAAEDSIPESYKWLETHLAGVPEDEDAESGVRIFVTGVREWRKIPRWPPADTMAVGLYLRHGKELGFTKPSAEGEEGGGDSSSSFTFDPAHPTPTVGGAFIGFGSGCVIDDTLAARSDVLPFTTTPLDRDIEVMGTPTVELSHSSDTPYVDLFVRISDVDARGYSRNVTEVYKRLASARPDPNVPVTVKLTLSPCAHVFQKGHSIRLLVAGGNYPMFHPNPGTSADAVSATELKAAIHTIGHSKGRVSSVVLPVLK
ncbi:hydrolase CocE/NonD family protein [Apodospora peruviana]|uniref:Hydrolase CocE/NonD family protein n=1 Tax=Apodospora peruviana TaxID=516989 RepID=A0AAE0MEU3_9PEZI|nr:hydrolase CocE/NonD family protein [Apodospora peruviana]